MASIRRLARTLRRYVFLPTSRLLAMLLAAPFILMGYYAILVDRFSEVSLAVSKVPFSLGEFTRYYYYKATLMQLGKDVTFRYGSFCLYRNAYIGDRVIIGHYTALGEVSIGDDALIGAFVNFMSGTQQHSFEDPALRISQQRASGRRVIHIGSDVWIGNNSLVFNDIGNRCVVGAGSIVAKKLPDKGVYIGTPTKLVRRIETTLQYRTPGVVEGE